MRGVILTWGTSTAVTFGRRTKAGACHREYVPALRPVLPIAAFRRFILDFIHVGHLSGITALVRALVVIVAAIALFASFDNLVSAKRSCRRRMQHIDQICSGDIDNIIINREESDILVFQYFSSDLVYSHFLFIPCRISSRRDGKCKNVNVPVKQFLFLLSSIASRTLLILPMLHFENLLLFGRFPLVAEANII